MDNALRELYNTILERKEGANEGSYTAYLFEKGKTKILKKIGEESTEVVISALEEDKANQVNEICDLTYHVMVLMAELDIPLEMVEEELKKRSEKIGNFKGERKKIENI